MAKVYKCNQCGQTVVSRDNHKCSSNEFTKIDLDPKAYCEKFGHSDTETEVPGSHRQTRALRQVWENESKVVDIEFYQVLVRCSVCGRAFYRSEEQRLN